MAYTRQKTLHDLGNYAVSTSTPVLIADATQISLSVVTTGAGSPVTVQMANANGLTSALVATDWSSVTALTSNGVYAVESGPRWLRTQRESASSATVTLSYLVND